LGLKHLTTEQAMLKIAGLHRELTKTTHRSKIGAAFHRMLVSYDNVPQI